jgi:UDP-N-acetylglucosamine 3-dehydrogenase
MDKPLATDTAQARELCDVAVRRKVVLAVCHNLMFHPALSRVLELIEAGVLGRATHASAWSSGWLDLPRWDFRLDREATGGGAWVDGAPHLVYLLEACLGPMRRLDALLSRSASRLGGEDTAVGQALFRSGAVASIRVGYADCPLGSDTGWPEGWRLGLDLIGTDGRMVLEFLPRAQVTWQRKAEAEVAEEFWTVPFDVGFEGAFTEFVSAVNGTAPLSITPWASLRNLELIRSAIDS